VQGAYEGAYWAYEVGRGRNGSAHSFE
jgi:hypothetical protein